MTNLNLTELDRLERETTQGAWFWNSYDAVWCGKGEESEVIAWVSHLNETDRGDEIHGPRLKEARANAELIEAAQNQLRPLLDLVDRLGVGLDWALSWAHTTPPQIKHWGKEEKEQAKAALADYQRAKENK